jgi:hypothetical protein
MPGLKEKQLMNSPEDFSRLKAAPGSDQAKETKTRPDQAPASQSKLERNAAAEKVLQPPQTIPDSNSESNK